MLNFHEKIDRQK